MKQSSRRLHDKQGVVWHVMCCTRFTLKAIASFADLTGFSPSSLICLHREGYDLKESAFWIVGSITKYICTALTVCVLLQN